MAIRQFEFTVSDSGITPATEQRVSIQTEHAAAELCFTLHSDLFAKLNEEKGNGKAVYRFDCYDSSGGSVKTESLELTENVVKLTVGESITRHGGKVAVYLVITVINSEGKTVLEFLSAPARLRIEQIPSTVSNNGESKESFSTLAEATKKYASQAEEAKDEALAMRGELEETIAKKANSDEVNSKLQSIRESLNGKANSAEVASGFQSIQSDIDKKAEKTEVDKLSNDIMNADLHIDSVEEKVEKLQSEAEGSLNALTEDMSGKMDKFGNYSETANAIYSKNLKFYGIATPDGTDSTAAVNLEYLNGVVGDINSVLSQLVETEE